MTVAIASATSERTGEAVVKSVARTLQTLELFDEIRVPMNVVEVSKRLGYPQSSTSALMKSMVSLGYLTYDMRRRTYFPTDRVALTGAWMKPALYGSGELMRLLNAVMERSHQVVVLSARNGDFAQYIQIARHKSATDYPAQLGEKQPLNLTAPGQALLSTLPDADIQKIYRRMNAYRPEGSALVDVPELLSAVGQARRSGSVSCEDASGRAMLAMLLPLSSTETPLAIAIAGSSETLALRRAEFVQILREEILHFFGHLGHPPVLYTLPRNSRNLTSCGKLRAAGM